MTKALTVTGIAIFFVFSLLLLSFSQETLTITTYYPSPYGSYNQLQTNSLGVGDTDNDDSLDSGDVPTTTGHVWIAGNVGIGTTSPQAPAPNDQPRGNLDVNDVFLRSTSQWVSQITGGIPGGAVMAFNLPNCPSGWSELVGAQGRYIVGLPSGGTLGGTQGTALSNLENRPTGGHGHYGHQGVRGEGATIARITRIYPQGGAGSSPSSVSNHGSDPGPTLPALIDTVAGTNAPYIQLLVCQKN